LAIEPNWQALIVFLIAWLVGCVGFFYVAGNLPVQAAPRAVRSGLGQALIWINLAIFILLGAVTVMFAVSTLRWTSIVVGGGFVFLFAPFIVQDLPPSLKDTRAGLITLLVCMFLAMALIFAAGP